jgi:hypothetical protein
LKNLSIQNQCRLLKLLHSLFNVTGRHCVRDLLPTYRAPITVQVRNSASTSFWERLMASRRATVITLPGAAQPRHSPPTFRAHDAP